MIVSTVLKQKGHEVVTVEPADDLATVSRVLTENRIGAVPVCRPDGALAGIISERDIVAALAGKGQDCLRLQAMEVMARDVVTKAPNATIDELMVLMTEGRFRHVPIVQDEKLVGIISIGDVVKARISEIELERDAMKQYIAAG